MTTGPLRLRGCSVDFGRRRVVYADGSELPLTPKEVELLVYLSARPDEEVPTTELMTEVWSYAPTVVSRAVFHTVQRLRRKVERDPAEPEHLLTVRAIGYRFAPLEQSAAPAVPLIGRAALVQDVVGLLARHRLVSLVGPPGVGKTRVAQAVPGDRRFVDLTGVTTLAGLEAAIEAEIGRPDRSLGLLVVLDNFEQLLPHAVPVVERWLRDGLQLLVTSRRRLGLSDEVVVAVDPLPTTSAVELLVERVRQVAPGYDDDPVALAELATALDGLPLALELAARRLEVVRAADLIQALAERRLQLLDGPVGTRTLLGALEGAWRAIEPATQRALSCWSVFRGPFSAARAQRVVGRDGWAVDALQRALSASLLQRTDAGPTGPSFRMLQSVREFARDRLPVEAGAERRYVEALLADHPRDPRLPSRFELWRPGEFRRLVADQVELAYAYDLALAADAHVDAARLALLLEELRITFEQDASSLERLPVCDLPQDLAVAVACARIAWKQRSGDPSVDAEFAAALSAYPGRALVFEDARMVARREGPPDPVWRAHLAALRAAGDLVRWIRSALVFSTRLSNRPSVPPEAIEVAREAVDAAIGSDWLPRARAGLANALFACGRHEEVVSVLRAVVELPELDPQLEATAHCILAQGLRAVGERAGADEHEERARQVVLEHPRMRALVERRIAAARESFP